MSKQKAPTKRHSPDTPVPANTQRDSNVVTTSLQRHVVATLCICWGINGRSMRGEFGSSFNILWGLVAARCGAFFRVLSHCCLSL